MSRKKSSKNKCHANDVNAFKALVKKLKLFYEEFNFKQAKVNCTNLQIE